MLRARIVTLKRHYLNRRHLSVVRWLALKSFFNFTGGNVRLIALKKINNNFALCRDQNGTEMIAYGKGIGFGQFPCEVPLAQIDRTYYNVDEQYLSVLSELPDQLLVICTKIVDYAQGLYDSAVPTNLIFTLGDHLEFAIKRQRENIHVSIPFSYDIQHLYPREYKIGKYGVDLIQKELGVQLPQQEIAGIALHFINNCNIGADDERTELSEKVIKQITRIIEHAFEINIDYSSFNYYRFTCHIRYYVKRIGDQTQFKGSDETLYLHMKQTYPAVYSCMLLIQNYLEQTFQISCSTEEQLYLMIHINRLCTNEDCNR